MQVTHMCIPDFRDIAQNPTCLPYTVYTPLSRVQVVEMWTLKKINSFWTGCHFKNICPVHHCGCRGQKWGNWVGFEKINFTVIQLCFNEYIFKIRSLLFLKKNRNCEFRPHEGFDLIMTNKQIMSHSYTNTSNDVLRSTVNMKMMC